ncbi:abortive infection family protein [Flaviaesturariibacter amylovorans]
MSGGFVLDFSNNTFQDFFKYNTGRNIYDDKYGDKGNSKANRLRCFWEVEPNLVVAKVLRELATYWREVLMGGCYVSDEEYEAFTFCLRVVEKLEAEGDLDIDAIKTDGNDEDFDRLAQEIREAIERDAPDVSLDRLHTFVTKHIRKLCDKHALEHNKEMALHGLFGRYVNHLKKCGHLESGMSEKILKTSISVLEEFNHVRNHHSFAHDNSLLNYDESRLIFKSISSLVEFIKALESRVDNKARLEINTDEQLPF